MASDRLQKILSQRGYGSRRDCENIIRSQRVVVNGELAVLGGKADPELDRILVDGIPVPRKSISKIYIAFNKPKFVLSEIKKKGKRKIIKDFIPINEFIFIVGRLDFRSEGLILLTNDGEIANRLTHPKYEHEKEYKVLIKRPVDQDQIDLWRQGVKLNNGYKTLPAEVRVLESNNSQTWLKIVIREGKKRQIRQTGEELGLPVSRIIRERIGTLTIGKLKTGEWRYLTNNEIIELKNYAGLGNPNII